MFSIDQESISPRHRRRWRVSGQSVNQSQSVSPVISKSCDVTLCVLTLTQLLSSVTDLQRDRRRLRASVSLMFIRFIYLEKLND